jgi:pimeloyl-ACP methyl ester carboxylesterase
MNSTPEQAPVAAGTIRPEFTTIDGLRIRYATSPKVGAETVLLFSPWPESLLAFLPIWDMLAPEFSLIAVDLPGFGLSEGRPELLSPSAMGRFLIQLNAHLGLEKPHAIAPDVASPSVLFAEAIQASTFRSLFIGSGACSFPLIVSGVLQQIIEAESLDVFRTMDTEAIVLNSLSEIKPYVTLPEFVVADYLAAAADGRFVEAMNFVRAYKTDLPALSPQLPVLTTPVHIISGRRDPNVPVADAEALHKQLPNSALTVLECGHYTWEEEAETYGRLALDWLRGGYQNPASSAR